MPLTAGSRVGSCEVIGPLLNPDRTTPVTTVVVNWPELLRAPR